MNTVDIRRARLREWFSGKPIPEKEKSYISQLINGKASFGERAARRLETDYGMGYLYLDTPTKEDVRAAAVDSAKRLLRDKPLHDPATETLGPSIQTPLRPVRAIDNPDEIEHDILQIPRYTLRASAGAGEPVLDIDEFAEPNYARRSWAVRRGLNPSNLFSIVSTGNSMEPEIHDGDGLIVHRQPHIDDNKLMVICYMGECYVKRVLRQFDGSLIVKSTNPEYKDVMIQPEQAEELQIVGRVVSIIHNA